MTIKLKKIGLGKKLAKIQNKNYVFISVGHPWNECVAYSCDADGNIIDDEPVSFAIGCSSEQLANQIANSCFSE